MIEAAILLGLLRRVERARVPVDVIHSHFFSGAQAISLMAQVSGIAHVHTEHSSAFCREQREPGRMLSASGARGAKRLFQRAARVLFVSSYLQREAQRSVGFSDGLVVPNPIDTDLFAAEAVPPTEKVRLIHVGRLSPEKGLVALLEAFAVAARVDSRLRLSLVGGGPQEMALRQRVAALEIQEEVEFLGPRAREEIPGLLSGSHVYISNSFVETFGVSVAEAVSAGRLVVAPRHCALPEVVGDTGVLFQHGSTDALVRAIQEAVARLPSWQPNHGRAFAMARYSLKSVADRLAGIYLDVSRRKGHRSEDARTPAH